MPIIFDTTQLKSSFTKDAIFPCITESKSTNQSVVTPQQYETFQKNSTLQSENQFERNWSSFYTENRVFNFTKNDRSEIDNKESQIDRTSATSNLVARTYKNKLNRLHIVEQNPNKGFDQSQWKSLDKRSISATESECSLPLQSKKNKLIYRELSEEGFLEREVTKDNLSSAKSKLWSVFTPEKQIRRLIDENIDLERNLWSVSMKKSAATAMHRASSILESGIRSIRQSLPSTHPVEVEDKYLFRKTNSALSGQDCNLEKVKTLKLIEKYGGIPSPVRISVDRKIPEGSFKHNRASILRIKFVTNEWVIPSYIIEHFKKFHKPPFGQNGNVSEKKISESVTIVVKLTETSTEILN